MSIFSTALIILLVAGVVAWLLRPRVRRTDPEGVFDPEALDDAEAEVRGLDAFTTPDDAQDELPDWGPGAPRP